jgi:hypothetical protein
MRGGVRWPINACEERNGSFTGNGLLEVSDCRRKPSCPRHGSTRFSDGSRLNFVTAWLLPPFQVDQAMFPAQRIALIVSIKSELKLKCMKGLSEFAENG